MRHGHLDTRRAGMALAFCAFAAVAACSKEVGDNAKVKDVGAKIDNAVQRGEEKLSKAGERAKEEMNAAAEKTRETLSKGGDRASDAATPPYSARQQSSESVETTTTTLSTGPQTSVKMSGISVSPETRARVDDAVITASVKAGLVKDPDLSALKIDVDTKDGVVTLNGLAGNEPAKQRAGKMAQSVKGVREVRNFLTLKQG